MEQVKDVVEIDQTIVVALEDLKNTVECFNQMSDVSLRGETYHGVDKHTIFSVTRDGISYGYRIVDAETDYGRLSVFGKSVVNKMPRRKGMFERQIYVKCLEARLKEIGDEERERIIGAVFEALLDQNMPEVGINIIATDCMLISQVFMVAFLEELSPGLRQKGGFGRLSGVAFNKIFKEPH